MISRTINLTAAAGFSYLLYRLFRTRVKKWMTIEQSLGSYSRSVPGKLLIEGYDRKLKINDDEILYWDPETGLFMKGGNI